MDKIFLTTGEKLKWTKDSTTTSTTLSPTPTTRPLKSNTILPNPTTPKKKEKEKVTSMASEAFSNDFLMKKMMQNSEMLKEYLDYLQKQDKDDKIEESAGSSDS